MTLVVEHAPGRWYMTKGGVSVIDTSLKTFGLVHSAQIVISGQAISYPDLTKGTSYWWQGSTFSGGSGGTIEEAHGYITAIAEEHSFSDILLGTVPTGTDYLDVKAKITRTTNPSALLGDTIPMIPPSGKSIRLLGGSCLLEETYCMSRGFAIVLSGTNVYLRRYQSVGADTDPTGVFGYWSNTNSNSDSGYETYTVAKGRPVLNTGNYPQTSSSSLSFTHQRGQSNQVSLTDTSNFASVYSADLVITPGFFNTALTQVAPATKSAVRTYANLQTNTAATTSMTFSSVPFGLADASRLVLVCVAGTTQGSNLTGVTIGGVTATKLTSAIGLNQIGEIWIAAVPSGTSGSVILSYGSAVVSLGIAVFALYQFSSAAAHNTQTATSATTVTLTTVAGGFAFGVSNHTNNPVTLTRSLSGFDKNGFMSAGTTASINAAVQMEVGVSATTGANISATLGNFSSSAGMCCASLA